MQLAERNKQIIQRINQLEERNQQLNHLNAQLRGILTRQQSKLFALKCLQPQNS